MLLSQFISLSILLSTSVLTGLAAPTNETATLESRQILHLGDKDDFWCDRVQFKDSLGLGDCNGTPDERALYFTGLPAKITAKTNLKRDGMMRLSRSGTGSGVRQEFCDRMVPISLVLRQLQKSGACAAAAKKIVGGRSTIQAALEKVDSKFNRRTMQRERLFDIKKALLVPGRPTVPHNVNKLDLLAVMHYIIRQRTESLAVAKRVDQEIQFAFHIAAGVENEWTRILFRLQKARTKLLAQVQREIDQAKGGCDSDVEMASPGGSPSSGGRRLQARYLSTLRADASSNDLLGFSALPLTSLQRRAARTPRSGPKAPPCPTCPKKGQKPQTGKKMVPRSQVREKPKPATKPRKPVTKPNPRPRDPAKKTVKRPATRPLRAVGQQAKPKRTTPRRKPKTVPKPPRRPRGKPRSRRGRK